MKILPTFLLAPAALALGGICSALTPGFAPTGFLDDDEEDEAAVAEEVEEEEGPHWLLLEGGDIFTGTGAVLRGADLLSKDGIIEEIGYDFWVPEDAERIDCSGLRLYPGMVALSATSRVTQGSFAPAGEVEQPGYDPSLDVPAEDGVDIWDFDAIDAAAAMTEAESRIAEAYDPFSTYLILTLAAGITTVEQSNAAVKLRRYEIKDVVMREGFLISLSYSTADSRRRTRADFALASTYLRDFRAWEEGGKDGDEPSKKGVNSSVLKILMGDGRAKFNADDRDELLAIARLAQEFGFRPVIEGCREGWVVADELGRAGATAIVSPRDRRWKDELQVADGGSSIENAAILHAAGVQVAVEPLSGSIDLGGIAGRDLLHLNIDAGFAIRGGLSEQAGLEAVTIVPARVMGVDHRVGSLEVGKDADVLVTDGDLLHYETFVQYAVVGGKLAYEKSEELFYAHIRPLPEREVVEASQEGDVEVEDADDEGDDEDGDDDGDEDEDEDED
ncbi:amidohydrolase family protein [Engelhardtia mirabilis]|uniref:Amidohydrolase-related domain-containing protein n=1 Tax=Engelhardtia mirabilis TaxID=2528011 RepID=A0A518BDI4_9BACT|nr:hypothetical protein Pla133_01230 [Planctomycetes bacterium Pla133]QDU99386.1 hypothetical protein Pla86_01230 [Planctomycetes bacterium Pla86]